MNMITMLAIFSVIYFVTLLLIIVYRNRFNPKIGNIIFITTNTVFFFFWNYAVYLGGGLKSFMTLDNISPLIFTVTFLLLFMSDKAREYTYAAIAFLSFGMFLAMYISPEHAYIFSFYEKATMYHTSEALCHLNSSLFGIYLMLTGQVKTDFKTWKKSIIFMYSIITLGVILNFIFHKSFFGMDPYGNYTIYMFNLFGSFPITLTVYYLGVLAVLTLGMQMGQLIIKLANSYNSHNLNNESAEEQDESPEPAEKATAAIGCSEENRYET